MTWPEYLDKLATTALLGTELSEQPSKPPLPALEAWTNRIGVEGKEGRFLALAAGSFLYDRAGRQAETVAAFPQSAPKETLPLINQAARDRLHAMLSGHHPEILGEFLERAARLKRRLPPRYLPALFARAMKESELWPALNQAMGERGKWLALQNPDWRNAAPTPDESVFHTGARADRLACLRSLKVADAARARSLLQASWAEEKPEDRAAFLEILLSNISLEDEAFFEQALTDKRKEVREIALEGLARLPQSALEQRMQARLSELIKVIQASPGQVKLEIELPEALASAWQKDGIEAKSKVQGLGDQAYRLYGIVAAAPLASWDRLAAMAPGQWVQTIHQTDWHDAILLGLAKAAIRQQNQDWGLSVLQTWTAQPRSFEYAARREMAQNLIASFDPAHRETFLIGWMEREQSKKEGEMSSYFAFFLNAMNHLWSADFTEKVLRFFVWAATGSKDSAHVFGIRWKDLGRYATPEFHERAQELLSKLDDSWKPALEPFVTMLGFREAMLKEIAQ